MFPMYVCMYACMYIFVQRVCIALKHVCLRIRLSLAVWPRMQQFPTGDSGGPGYLLKNLQVTCKLKDVDN